MPYSTRMVIGTTVLRGFPAHCSTEQVTCDLRQKTNTHDLHTCRSAGTSMSNKNFTDARIRAGDWIHSTKEFLRYYFCVKAIAIASCSNGGKCAGLWWWVWNADPKSLCRKGHVCCYPKAFSTSRICSSVARKRKSRL